MFDHTFFSLHMLKPEISLEQTLKNVLSYLELKIY